MNKKDIAVLHKKLLEQREDIIKIVQKNREGEKEFLSGEVGDIADVASDSIERELLFELNDSERKVLKNIEDALRRIENEVYGVCDKCGKEIELERLEIMPFTEFCIGCKSKMEPPSK